MKTTLILAFLAALLPPALRAEDDPYPPVNPALLYWQAAAVLPRLSDAQAKEVSEMAAGRQPADSAKLMALGVGLAAGLLQKAAASPAPCDWGILKEDGPEALMPHIPKLMELASIAIIQGEASLAQGKTAEGLDWLLSAHRIARHSGAGETLISFLVQTSIETLALKAAARHCLGWDEATRHGYAEGLKALPPLHGSRESYHGERAFIDWFERLHQLPEPRRTEKLTQAFRMAGNDGSARFADLMDTETLRKELSACRELHTRVEAAFGKPWRAGRPELEAIEKEIGQSEFTLVKTIMPAVVSVYDKGFITATLRTMLDAALEHGAQLDEDRAATYRDAFEGAPLRLRKAKAGELSLVAAGEHPKGSEIALNLVRSVE